MSDKSQRLYDCLTEIDDELVEETADWLEAVDGSGGGGPRPEPAAAPPTAPARRTAGKPAWRRWGALAAVLVFAVGAGGYALTHSGIGGLGGNYSGGSDGASPPAAGEGGDGGGATTFMSYAGPVFPLTLAEADSGVSASREVTMDFAPWQPVWRSNEEELAARQNLTEEETLELAADLDKWYPEGGYWQSGSDILVTDAYQLTNNSDTDRTLRVLYPFAGTLRDCREPALSLDGEELETRLHAGPYAGGFRDVDSEGEERWNISQPSAWTDYQKLLGSGQYQAQALAETADLSGVPVIVYRFDDLTAPEKGGRITNPTLAADYDMDYAATTVLTYGFNGGSWNEGAGHRQSHCSVPEAGRRDYGKSRYLFVLGRDIANLTLAGYPDGGCEPGEEIDGVSALVTRYESNLADCLWLVLRQERQDNVNMEYLAETPGTDGEAGQGEGGGQISEALHYRAFSQLFSDYGPASPRPAERYAWDDLSSMVYEALTLKRVFYLEAEIAIPAGQTVSLTARASKAASHDYYCAHTENQGISGYDLTTVLGSNLRFTSQSAALEDRGQIEIVRQNFGFDLAADIRQVELDAAVEDYYLEVRRLPEKAASEPSQE